MTRMLASVVNSLEVETILHTGVDIIDLKDPHSGALGALPTERIQSLVEQIAQRRPVSATVGDLPPDPTLLAEAIQRTATSGVNYVKVGFFLNLNLHNCIQAIAAITANHPVIAVLFADRSPPLDRLPEFAAAGFRGIMLDTAEKRQGHLPQHIGLERLDQFVATSRRLGLLSGLAGSLRLQDIPHLLPLAADYLGFRGALCEQSSRVAKISHQRVVEIRNAITPGVDLSRPGREQKTLWGNPE
ncbi:MAG: (5-formylfuran-3-yl)methyl phosphate synthase [Candidatus Thiodiazotropha sp. (ex Ustalcina ferruginea)]|nr:(5-formylfuran-3-yl)methyl phosphate synthase [Candidatus Thiodiazotropha sp. (ex Ustalcina ferruginea)]